MSDFNYEIERTDHYFFENFTVDGKTVQDGTPTPDAPVDVQVVGTPNMCDSSRYATANTTAIADFTSLTTATVNNITFERNADGSIRAHGTNTSTAMIYLPLERELKTDEIVTLTGCPTGGSTSRYRLDLYSTANAIQATDYGSGVTRTLTGDANRLRLAVYSGTWDITFKPQLELGSTATPYVPYGSIGIVIGDTATPIDLQGNVLASLPDGTRDRLTVDSAGHVVIEKNVGAITFNGSDSEKWSIQSNGNRIAMQSNWPWTSEQYPKPNASASATGNVYCNAFAASSPNALANGGIGIAINNASYGITFAPLLFGDGSGSMTVEAWMTWLQSNPVTAYYPLLAPQTIDLGYIDVSSLQDIETEIPITLIASLETETEYSYSNKPTYKVENPYENANAPEYAYPPNHFGQEWETFDANDWNVSEMLEYTGQPESHAVYTVELCELMQSGAFNWSRPELDWSEAAYDAEQYERFCKYFESRFMFREISMLPPLQWFTALKRMLVYELMPKYKPLYAQIANGISPLGENEYYKERHVSSSYPETLLSGNSDYISSGEDREFERIKVDNAAEALEAYRNGFRSVDAALGDELEILFISMYTSFVNAF